MRFESEIVALEKKAKGSKWSRLWNQPLRYLSAQWFVKVQYPKEKKGRLALATTFFGDDMHLLLPAGMDIYLLGGKSHDSEIRLARCLCHYLKAGDFFLDIGAHFGYFSLLAAQLVGDKGKIESIEASKAVFNILKKNTKESKVNIQHLACTDQSRMVDFYEFPILYSEYNSLHASQYDNAAWLKDNPPQHIQVNGTSVDDFLKEKKDPNFIKIDVEGAELEVLKGMQNLLRNTNKPLIIAMEYLPNQQGEGIHRKAFDFLLKMDFQAHIILPNGHLQAVTELETYFKTSGLDSDNIVFVKQVAR